MGQVILKVGMLHELIRERPELWVILQQLIQKPRGFDGTVNLERKLPDSNISLEPSLEGYCHCEEHVCDDGHVPHVDAEVIAVPVDQFRCC